VTNVLSGGRRHHEQAVFADGLSQVSVQEVWARIGSLWKGLLGTLVPLLEEKVERDQSQPGPMRRLRVGLYTFDADTAPAPAPPAPRGTRKRP
jgi:hypothetical protein